MAQSARWSKILGGERFSVAPNYWWRKIFGGAKISLAHYYPMAKTVCSSKFSLAKIIGSAKLKVRKIIGSAIYLVGAIFSETQKYHNNTIGSVVQNSAQNIRWQKFCGAKFSVALNYP